jgi:DNA polymerase-4
VKVEDYKWLFVDMNSYFASCEEQERPELRGKPVAVVPMLTDYTVAIAANYIAKAYGVTTETPILEAKRLCPDLRCILARHDVYVRYHHRVHDEVLKHVPISKVWSIDEMASRLPPTFRNRPEAEAVARRIKDGIRKNVGEALTCSIGIAPNSFLAKVATDIEKPDGLVVLDSSNLPDRVLALKLTDLPGISSRRERRLNRAGITSIEQFMHLPPRQARMIWGSVLGERMWHRLHGHDVEDPPTKTKTKGHSRTLEPDLRKPEAAWWMARKLAVKAAARLRREEFFATIFNLSMANSKMGPNAAILRPGRVARIVNRSTTLRLRNRYPGSLTNTALATPLRDKEPGIISTHRESPHSDPI